MPLLPRDSGALDAPRDASLLLDGGVNGRKPSRLPVAGDCAVPRCGSIVLEPMLCEPTLDDPILVRSEVAGADGRLLVLGGVNGRYPPRVPLCVEDA